MGIDESNVDITLGDSTQDATKDIAFKPRGNDYYH